MLHLKGESLSAFDPSLYRQVVLGQDADADSIKAFLETNVHHFDLIGPVSKMPGIQPEADNVNLMLSVEFTKTLTTQTPLPSRQQVEHPSSMLSVPLCPATVTVISNIQHQSSSKPLTALIDSGSTYSHISAKALPSGTSLMRPYAVPHSPEASTATLLSLYTISHYPSLIPLDASNPFMPTSSSPLASMT
jgi:hypothetical protein